MKGESEENLKESSSACSHVDGVTARKKMYSSFDYIRNLILYT